MQVDYKGRLEIAYSWLKYLTHDLGILEIIEMSVQSVFECVIRITWEGLLKHRLPEPTSVLSMQ
jgi:hypothetical protein